MHTFWDPTEITFSKTSEITFSLSIIKKWQPQPRISYCSCILQVWKWMAIGFADGRMSPKKSFSIKFYTKAETRLWAPDPTWSSRCCFQLQQVFIQKQLPPCSTMPHGSHKILLACINERPGLELQQKYNKTLHYHHFPSQRGAHVGVKMILHGKDCS